MSKKKVFWISCFEKIGSKKNFKKYSENAFLALKKFKGKLIFGGNSIIGLEGKKFKRIVCFEFENTYKAKKCFNSIEYKKAKLFLKNNKSVRHLNLLNL